MSKLSVLIPVGLALLVGGHAFAGPGGLFDGEDDEEKAKKEWREAEEGQQGEGEGQPGQAGPGGMMQENPLEKIIEMMTGVEDKLFEADTGEWTQQEQREIVQAMRFEDKTSQALEELIRKIEEEQKRRQQQSSSSSDQDQQQKNQQNQQDQNETEEQRRERERREREKQQREKEQEKQRQQNQQNQQDQQKQDQQQNDQQSNAEQNRQEDQSQSQNPEEVNDSDPEAGAWGRLPKKLHQDANNARNAEPPARWRELIERYRIRLAEDD